MAFAMPAAEATSDICFTAVNNTLEPLDNNTMPIIIGSLLYIPCAFFSSEELGVNYISSGNQVMLYYGSKFLIFDTELATVVDQNKNQYNIPALKKNGRIYVPVDEVCELFGLTYQVISGNPAPVVRFYKSSIYSNENNFITLNKTKMQTYYDDYVGKGAEPSAAPVSPAVQTFEHVTVFLSFYDLAPNNFEAILNALDMYRYKCTFFVSSDEIAADADLLRRAAGAGHTIGIWLEEGTYDEYQDASALLFEAAKIPSVIICAGGNVRKTAEETAKEEGLVFWRPIQTYNGTEKITIGKLTGKLRDIDSSRISMNLSCTDKMGALAGSLCGYLSEKKYVVRRITETTAPTYSIG